MANKEKISQLARTNNVNSDDLIAVNKKVDDTNYQTMAAAAGLLASIPTGTVLTYASKEPPLGYLLCDGQPISRTQYSALFGVIGTTYGAGDGTQTFNLPDLRGMFVRGWDGGRGKDPEANKRTDNDGTEVGDKVGSEQGEEIKEHKHQVPNGHNKASAYPWGYSQSNKAGNGGSTDYDNKWPYTSPIGGAETRPVNMALAYIIKT